MPTATHVCIKNFLYGGGGGWGGRERERERERERMHTRAHISYKHTKTRTITCVICATRQKTAVFKSIHSDGLKKTRKGVLSPLSHPLPT